MKTFLALLIIPSVLQPVRAAEPKPNILMIYADDLGYADVGFNGRKEWQTPNIDHLAHEGTIFQRWYTACAVCEPSRAALMTGRYDIHNGVTGNHSFDLPGNEVTIAAALKRHGYNTALFGKWHHGWPRAGNSTYINPIDRGFDEFFGFTDGEKAWEKFPKQLWFGRMEKPVSGYADTLFADHTVDYIEHYNSGKPFFIYLAFIAPHGKQEAPQVAIQRELPHFKDTSLATARIQATYAAQVTQMDTEIGRVMKALSDAHLAENTLVVFSSDNGAGYERQQQGSNAALDSNRPFRGQKRTLWDGGIHMPALVCWPGHIPAGRVSDDIVDMIDLFPTFLAAAGAQPDPAWKVDGVNLLPTFQGKTPAPDRIIFWQWNEIGDRQLAAMDGRFKLIDDSNNVPQLYDVVADPVERMDIRQLFPAEVKKLTTALRTWYSTITPAAKLRHSTPDDTPHPIVSDGHSVDDE